MCFLFHRVNKYHITKFIIKIVIINRTKRKKSRKTKKKIREKTTSIMYNIVNYVLSVFAIIIIIQSGSNFETEKNQCHSNQCLQVNLICCFKINELNSRIYAINDYLKKRGFGRKKLNTKKPFKQSSSPQRRI